MRPLKDVRLFFALWPDHEIRLRMRDNLKLFNLDSNKNRLVTSSNLHMTLHFVGNSSFEEMNCFDRQAGLTQTESFSLRLDCSGYFKKPRVLWFGCLVVPPALFELQRKLGRNLDVCDYSPETRPFSPHVTVARKISEEPEAISLEPIDWPVNRFVLVKSMSIPGGVRYEVVGSYPLG